MLGGLQTLGWMEFGRFGFRINLWELEVGLIDRKGAKMRFFVLSVVLGSQLFYSVSEASVADRILRRKLLRSLQIIEYSIAASDRGSVAAPTIIVG